ncbi:MAG: protein translocase subunit SecD [Candidatus Cloacimonetes bacterium]|jgi:SecD/SecF fusion protein|nr:protein translocase subunit SecD [Candidatus Cloacimonadota bacterium]MBT6994991.1 protein translocase subunit SecD [Candidatus Cloacimonadota bacterium]MBT7469846.1 protein translocase subunit SecD [Candidatus Cloacimonadota bacterium]
MRKSKIRGMIILAVLLVTAYFFLPLVVPNLPSFWTEKRLKLGLDLQGGSQIQLEVDYSKLQLTKKEEEEAVKTALQIIRNRIDQFGVAEPELQRISNSNRILIQLPGLKDPSRAKDLIGRTAMLEFKLVANGEETQSVIEILNAYLQENLAEYPQLEKFADASTAQTDVFDNEEESAVENFNVFMNLITDKDDAPLKMDYEHLELFRKLLKNENFKNEVPAGLQVAIGKENKDDPYASRDIFVLHKDAKMTGKYLEEAQTKIGQGYTQKDKGPYIALTFNKQGAEKFKNLTGQYINERLAILLDEIVFIAPTIQSRIQTSEARITGNFSVEEVHDLVIVLNAGSLPAPVKIIEERTVGPTLGKDSIKSGILAALIGMIAVIFFMMIYYKFSGIIAVLAVFVNMAFIVAVMTMLDGTLTMPGIAGMILTIGMAVDANVIIFERIRENLDAGKTVRSAVNSGFSRALVTILDANITTLITAIVLYQFGTGPIKGFAVTLSIGIIGSMFASIVLVKAIFDGLILNSSREKLSI